MATLTSPTRTGIWKPKTCPSPRPLPVETDLDQTIRRIQSKNPSGILHLRAKLSGGIRFFLSRSLGTSDVESVVEATLLIVAEAIQNGSVSGHDSLFALLDDVVSNHNILDRRTDIVRGRVPIRLEARNAIPGGDSAADPGTLELVRRALTGISKTDRETLARYYVLGQDEEQILTEAGLTPDQWRTLRSKARDRFIALEKSDFLPRKPVRSLTSRAAATATG